MKTKWEKVDDGKYRLIAQGFDLVYSESITNAMKNLSDNSIDMSDYDEGKDMTAIVVPDKKKYYVLKGDWRKQFEKAVPEGLLAVVNVYNKNKGKNNENVSLFSTDPLNDTPDRQAQRSKIASSALKDKSKMLEILSGLEGLEVSSKGTNLSVSSVDELMKKLKELRELFPLGEVKIKSGVSVERSKEQEVQNLLLNKENNDLILAKIREMTGAKAVVLFVSDNIIPCQDKVCNGHENVVASCGIERGAMAEVLEAMAKNLREEN